eukprot:177002-Alexandrium_andersonii.AAC.1
MSLAAAGSCYDLHLHVLASPTSLYVVAVGVPVAAAIVVVVTVAVDGVVVVVVVVPGVVVVI